MEKIENLISHFWLSILLILCIPAIWALFVPGYFGASDDVHIAWLHQFDKTIRLGQFPPRFVPDLSFGYGYPLFNFVFPLPFYVAEMFHLLGMNLVNSIKFVFLLSVPLSGIGMYFLLKQFTSQSLSLVGALLYIYTPYRSTDMYVRGAIGEIVAFVFLPLITLAVIRLTEPEKKNLVFIGLGALSLGMLVLTHNITTYMFFPFILLLGILRIVFLPGLYFERSREISKYFLTGVRKIFERSIPFILMTFLGLLVSIHFWLPALWESSLVKYDTVFNFVDHFPTIRQLFTPFWGYGASVAGPYDGMSFFLGYLNVGLLFVGTILTFWFFKKISKSQKILLGWVYFSLLIVFFMMNFRSSFLWANLPLLPYFQFPWRFLIMTTFLIPILLIPLQYLKSKYLPLILVIIILGSTGYMFRPHDFLGTQDEYFLKKYIPGGFEIIRNKTSQDEFSIRAKEIDRLYLTQGEEYLRLPVNTTRRPGGSAPFVSEVDTGTTMVFTWIESATQIKDLDYKIETNSPFEHQLEIHKYYFPGWNAIIDGKPVNLEIAPPYGQMRIAVPSGPHTIRVYFTETLFRQVFNIISLLAVITAILIVWKFKRSTKS